MGSNYYTNASGQDIYVANGAASLYQQNNGTHNFYSATSGTAGNVATLTSILETSLGQTLALQGATTQAGTGITFPATQSASSNANTLDDYEEGDWTPSLGGTTTYSAQLGKYVKVGKQVTVSFILTINAIGTGSTTRITGLPFNAAADTGYGSGVAFFGNSVTNIVTLSCYSYGSNWIDLYSLTAAGASMAGNAIFKNNTTVQASFTYFV